MDGTPHIEGGGQAAPGVGLMPRATIYQLEANRNRAILLYGEAWDAMAAATAAAAAAAPSGSHWGRFPEITSRDQDGGGYWGGDRDKYLAEVTKNTDRAVWGHLIASTKLDQLMDRAEREAFHRSLKDDPPPATADNCLATIERLMGDADLIFKRGIALAFSGLDRRFRSHDGFKIGSRIILNYAFSGDGYPNQRTMDTLYDVERAFVQLDGKALSERYAGIIGQIDATRRALPGYGAKAFRVEGDYFRVEVYKKGTAHLWFTRKDLVLKVNELLADYYGANLGAGADAADVKHAYASTPATSGPGGFGLFPSPAPVVSAIMSKAGLYKAETVKRYDGSIDAHYLKPKRVLEPSAGTGAISSYAADCLGAEVTCVEIQGRLAAELGASGRYAKVVHDDFLNRSPDELGRFDVIVMNPPFDGCRDVDHVTHALKFLAEGGVLVSVMGAGVEFREDRKTAAFRAEVERRGGQFFDLPPASFAESGTYINTVLVCIGRSYWS